MTRIVFPWTAALCLLIAVAATAADTPTAAPAAASASDPREREILAAEKKLLDAQRTRDVEARRAAYTSETIDIHGSGWIYTLDETLQLGANAARRTDAVEMKELQRTRGPVQIVFYGDDTAIQTWLEEVYFEVPNPQELARRAGTMLNDPDAQRRASLQMVEKGFGPGDTFAPNPLRTRETRLWVREKGVWKIALHQATRVVERTNFRRRITADTP